MEKFIKYLEDKIEGCEMTQAPYRDKIIYQLVLDEYKEQLTLAGVGFSETEVCGLCKGDKWIREEIMNRPCPACGCTGIKQT